MSSGADGLLKLWSVRTTECVNTFDEHEDRVIRAALRLSRIRCVDLRAGLSLTSH